jgi:multidrug efflux pump
MLGVTLFGIFLTPAFYVAIRWITGNKPFKHAKPHPPAENHFPTPEHAEVPPLQPVH